MDEGETNSLYQERLKQLERENEFLRAKIRELESRLAQYENAHTPPSLRRGRNRKKDQEKDIKGTPGQKIGHKGVTRSSATPDRQVEVTMDRCPNCGTELGPPFRIDSKIIEEILQPQSTTVTEYKIAHYKCPSYQKEVAARDPVCPHEGKFGDNVIALATLLKYYGRLPHRKIHETLTRLYGLKVSPATILDLTRRAADAIRPEYDSILSKIRDASVLYVDETSIHVQGENHWIWTFATSSETFIVI
jgi:transposase